MNVNKSQRLWYLLNRFDRDNESVMGEIMEDLNNYPFFYLIAWNSKQDTKYLSKTALRSPLRSNFYKLNNDAPELNIQVPTASNQNEIIEQFLAKLPSLTKPKKNVLSDENIQLIDLADTNWSPPVSETFAVILVKQQKYQQAIKIYEQLILAKPEKRLYFATRISELKQNINE